MRLSATALLRRSPFILSFLSPVPIPIFCACYYLVHCHLTISAVVWDDLENDSNRVTHMRPANDQVSLRSRAIWIRPLLQQCTGFPRWQSKALVRLYECSGWSWLSPGSILAWLLPRIRKLTLMKWTLPRSLNLDMAIVANRVLV